MADSQVQPESSKSNVGMGVLKLLQKEFVREILNDMELDFSLNISLKTGHFSHCQQNNNPLKHWVHHVRSVEIDMASGCGRKLRRFWNLHSGPGGLVVASHLQMSYSQMPNTKNTTSKCWKRFVFVLDRSGATPLWVSFFWYPGQIKDFTGESFQKRQVMETWWNSWELSVWCVPRDCVLALTFSKGKTMGMAGGNLVTYSWYLLMAFATCHALKDFEFDIHVVYTRKQRTPPQMKRVQKIMAKSNKFIHIFFRKPK